jgi:hypothetical protein
MSQDPEDTLGFVNRNWLVLDERLASPREDHVNGFQSVEN